MSTRYDRPYGPTTPGAETGVPVALNVAARSSPPEGPLPVTQVITGTGETLILAVLNVAEALLAVMPPDTANEQTLFDVVASGIISTEADGNLTLKLYEGGAIASGNLLKSSGTVAQNGGTSSVPVVRAFYIIAQLIYNSVSGELDGAVEFYINRTIVAKATLANFVTGFLNAGNPNANPATVANLPEFCFTLTSSGAGGGTPTTINVQKFSCG